jgi:hypothetical protein
MYPRLNAMQNQKLFNVLLQDSEEERSNTVRTQHDRLKEEVAAYKAQVRAGEGWPRLPLVAQKNSHRRLQKSMGFWRPAVVLSGRL